MRPRKKGSYAVGDVVVGGPAGVGRNRFAIMMAKIFVPFHMYQDMKPSASHVTTNIVADCCGRPEYMKIAPIIMLMKLV